MSIIYDALKKVEASGAKEAAPETPKPPEPGPRNYLVYALIICIIAFTANIFYSWLWPTVRSVKSPAQIVKIVKKELTLLPGWQKSILQKSPPVEAHVEPPKETPGVLTLNGVFFSGPEGYALINNRIVKKGDKIQGATVVQIYLDEVDLERDGSIIKLTSSTSSAK